MTSSFELTGVVHLVRPAFRHAASLEELREGIAEADVSSLFYHAVQHQLRSPTGELAPDDFSHWVTGVLQDRETAERLSFAVQRCGLGADPLRKALLQVLDSIPAGTRRQRDAPEGGEFVFLSLDSVPVPEGRIVEDAGAFFDELDASDPSVWFRELLEEPWFSGEQPSCVTWLRMVGESKAAEWIVEAAQSGRSIEGMHRYVMQRWRRRRLGARIAEASSRTDHERREVGRDVVARFVRRLRKDEERP